MNVQIIIRGRQFNVKTMDGASIKRRAKELDRRLTEQFERSRSFDEHSILMITALNILNELNLMKQQYSEQLQELDKEVEATIALIDALQPVNKTGTTEKSKKERTAKDSSSPKIEKDEIK